MFIEFSVANFRSFRERQTLSLIAGAGTEHERNNVIPEDKGALRLLRSAVIYGPNAAGKSNLLLALETLRQLVDTSAKLQEGQRLAVTPFLLSKESTELPSEFEIIFIAEDNVRYHYLCAVSAERVWKEWFVAYPFGRAQRWFEREYKPETNSYDWWFGPKFKGERTFLQEHTRSNALFFSTAIQLNNLQLKSAFTWIRSKLVVVTSRLNLNPGLSLDLLGRSDGNERIMRFIRAADVGIDRLEAQELDTQAINADGPLAPGAIRLKVELGAQQGNAPRQLRAHRVLAWHKRIDDDKEIALDMSDESDGTARLFQYMGGWIHALDQGATLIVDELDRSLHPHMTRFLIDLFQNRSNATNAQLVFTTHDTTLLDPNLLRRDQVWFIEKDKLRSSHLYSLLEYRPRKDEALERGYLKGRYGAIPFIGKLDI